jgi:hypothetical protein
MQHYMEEYPRTSRPAHRYNLGTPAEIARYRPAFRRYQEYFQVPDEV